jgi:hypothetical protein
MASKKVTWARQEDRKSKIVTITLTDEARAILKREGDEHEKGKSGFVEQLILEFEKNKKGA